MISDRGVRKGNFTIPFDGKGNPLPISLSRNYALLIREPGTDELPHPFKNVWTTKTVVKNSVPAKIREELNMPC
jgi:hypothetical protein